MANTLLDPANPWQDSPRATFTAESVGESAPAAITPTVAGSTGNFGYADTSQRERVAHRPANVTGMQFGSAGSAIDRASSFGEGLQDQADKNRQLFAHHAVTGQPRAMANSEPFSSGGLAGL